MRALIMLMLLVSPAFAGEVKLSAPEITSLLSDKTLYATINGKPAEQLFQKSGATFYSIGGAQSQGSWRLDGDKYCSIWPPNPSWVCYDVLRDDKMITFVSPSGVCSIFATAQ